jgi:Na+-driven multidrug efflux pump
LTLFLVTIFFLVSFDIPGLLIAAALSFAVATLMLVNFYRRELWKRDYEASLFRIVRPYLR